MKVSEMIKNVMDELMGNIKSGVETIEKAVAEDKALIVEISNRINDNFAELNAIETNTRAMVDELNAVADHAEDYHEDNAIYLANLNTLVTNEDYNEDLADKHYEEGYKNGYKNAEEDLNIEINQLKEEIDEKCNQSYDDGYEKGYDSGYEDGNANGYDQGYKDARNDYEVVDKD